MKQYFIPILFLFGTLTFAYLYVSGPGVQELEENNRKGKVTYNRLHNLKQQTKLRLDIRKEQALLDHNVGDSMLEAGQDKKNRFHKLNIQEGAGPAAFDVDNRKSASAITIDQRMDEFLAERQQYEDMELAQRQEYVRVFIEEARKIGYDVKIDNQMEIISVKKINAK